jgi:hypothetical protein
MNDESAQERALVPFAQQLDTHGRLHDIAPEHERLRLFEPDVQVPGQTSLEPDAEERAEMEPLPFYADRGRQLLGSGPLRRAFSLP